MLVVLPFHAGDAHQASNLLTWMGQLRGGATWTETREGILYGDHSIILLADASVDWTTARKLHKQATHLFRHATLEVNEPSVTGWPQGANALFACAAKKALVPFLWLEPDAIPLHPEWLNLIAEEYSTCGLPFMGHIYDCAQPNLPKRMLSGIAVYPADLPLPSTVSISDTAFDVLLSPFILHRAAHTRRIQHFWGEAGLPPTFPASGQPMPRNGFTFANFTTDAVLFHRNKDGTLIERLREKHGFVPLSTINSQPSTRGLMSVRRTAALGDVLCSTVVAKKLSRLGYDVQFQAHSSAHCILRRIPGIKHICDPQGEAVVNLDGAYENHRNRRNFHFAQMFVDKANECLRANLITDARNFAPRMVLEPGDAATAMAVLRDHPRPWTIICPRSNSWANRTVPDDIWCRAAEQITGTKFWLALHPAPHCSGIIDLACRHFDRAIGFLGVADLLVTVDTGPMHVAAALGTPVVAIQQASSPELHLSDQRDFIMVSPALNCLNCQIDLCPINSAHPPCQHIDPGVIARAVNQRLLSITGNGVSVVMSIYKPNVQKLNRALAHVLPQVQEIVVVSDMAGVVPHGAMSESKIRFVKLKQRDVGYGRKANYGARQTNHKYLLFLNDDVYLNAEAVSKLMACMSPDVGMVAHCLRYPDGTIQHGGTYRAPGAPGWGHLDHRARESRIKEPVEMENVCGASVLVRRKAFYDAGGFDEDFYLYCEDNALCLQLRQAGWKIIYTPHAEGIHEESQSTSLTQNIHEIMQQSHQTLKRKWGWYFEHNKHNAMGVFE